MLIALDDDDHRAAPLVGGRARCPLCRQAVIAKCGTLVIHHWAHQSQDACDDWNEPESDWHRGWKSLVPIDQQEQMVEHDGVRHRADITVELDGQPFVFEVQHSSISPTDIHAREQHYGRMGWIVDARDAGQRIDLERDHAESLHPDFRAFYWEHPRTSLTVATMPVWLDLGDELFGISQLHSRGALGYGHLWPRDVFVRRFLKPLPHHT